VDCSVEQTTDGGYIITARTTSYGVGNSDVYLIKHFLTENAQWTKTIGGANSEEGHSIKQTHDGKYIHCGLTNSFGAGNDDIYLIKNDTTGSTLFAKTFGGSGTDHGHFIQQASDNGFIIIGTTTSFGAGGYDIYLVKTDSTELYNGLKLTVALEMRTEWIFKPQQMEVIFLLVILQVLGQAIMMFF